MPSPALSGLNLPPGPHPSKTGKTSPVLHHNPELRDAATALLPLTYIMQGSRFKKGTLDRRPIAVLSPAQSKETAMTKPSKPAKSPVTVAEHPVNAPSLLALNPALPSLPFKVAAIAGRTSTHVRFRPSAPERAVIAQVLGLLSLPELTFDGDIRPAGKRDMVLEGKLAAKVVQPCSVTLEPVTTVISDPVRRQYMSDFKAPEADEFEIPEDDTQEALPEVIDAASVAIEALALALPLYPRAPGVELGEAVFTEPGLKPLREGDLKPFAALAGLVLKSATDPQDKT